MDSEPASLEIVQIRIKGVARPYVCDGCNIFQKHHLCK